MKHLIILASLCVALCADTNILDIKSPLTNIFELGHQALLEPRNPDDVMAQYFPASWLRDGSNFLTINLVTNIVTQWLPIEREDGPRGATVKQIGILVTNQVLTVIAYDKTNDVVLKVLGREEWPSQRRTVIVPNSQNAPRNAMR